MRTDRPSRSPSRIVQSPSWRRPLEARHVQIDGAFGLRLLGERLIELAADTSACRRCSSCGLAATSSCRCVIRHRRRTAAPGWWKKKVKPRFRPQATSGRAAATCPTSRTRESAADRSDPPAPRAEGWRAASTTRRWRIADGGRARSSTTRCPRFSSASAASEPLKPDPTMATSASMRVDQAASVMPDAPCTSAQA